MSKNIFSLFLCFFVIFLQKNHLHVCVCLLVLSHALSTFIRLFEFLYFFSIFFTISFKTGFSFLSFLASTFFFYLYLLYFCLKSFKVCLISVCATVFLSSYLSFCLCFCFRFLTVWDSVPATDVDHWTKTWVIIPVDFLDIILTPINFEFSIFYIFYHCKQSLDQLFLSTYFQAKAWLSNGP